MFCRYAEVFMKFKIVKTNKREFFFHFVIPLILKIKFRVRIIISLRGSVLLVYTTDYYLYIYTRTGLSYQRVYRTSRTRNNKTLFYIHICIIIIYKRSLYIYIIVRFWLIFTYSSSLSPVVVFRFACEPKKIGGKS